MKAVLCKSFGPPENLVIEEIPNPIVGDNDVLIDVHCAGINYPDTLIIQNKYQFKPPLPFTPGSEVSGIAEEVVKNVKHITAGDEVMGFSMVGGFALKMEALKIKSNKEAVNIFFSYFN